MDQPGQIVMLNGAPRSGKSSIARAIQERFEGPWLNLGVDLIKERATPAALQPGLGLRPGGERPELEPFVRASYLALYETIAAHSRQGLNIVADVGHHEGYSRPLHVLRDCARRLEGLPAILVGVHCPLAIIMERRRATGWPTPPPDTPVPEPIRRWQVAVHVPGIYDLELDTSALTPEACAASIRATLDDPPRPLALERLAADRDFPVNFRL